jgi:hypothetical protein
LWVVTKILSALEEDFRILKTSKKCDNGAKRNSTTSVQKMFKQWKAASLG